MNKYRLILLIFNVVYGISLFGQVVWTEPAFPNQSDDIILYYNATQGNAGLRDFSGEVYAHMGLITNNSSSPTDWKYVVGNWGTEDDNTLMTKEGPNLYSKAYNIEDFHGVEAGDLVKQLAFVFRNGDGSQAGRAGDGSDIYLEVFPPDDGLRVTLNSPSSNTIVYEGETVNINLRANTNSQVEITDNGNIIYNQFTDIVDIDLIAETQGTHELLITVDDGSETVELTRKYIVLDNTDQRLPKPDRISSYGLSYQNDAYGISLVAPGKEHVFLLCDDNSYSIDLAYRMNKDLDGNTFWIEIPKNAFTNSRYTYQFLVDGQLKIADPYSEMVLDPWNDDNIKDQSFYPTYPDQLTSGFVTVFEPEPNDFNWTTIDYTKPVKEELVIYELLMRDFLEDKSYTSLLDTLRYLSELGINAIELMPIQEFEGNNSWGYNPSFHNAIDKYYGSKEQLQRIIDRCHELGIAVILDVVFNHAFSQSPLCQLYWDPINFRPSEDNPWLNVTARHPFNVGYDFNHESTYTKNWVKESLRKYVTELNVDGFRFDLSKGLTQFNSGGNASLMSRYDQSRIDIISEYADFLWSIDEDLYVILEHFADADEEKELASKGMLLWSNTTFQFAEAAMGYESDLTGASYKSRGFTNPSLIAYMESHDEERMGYKIKTWGNNGPDYNTKEPWTFSNRIVATAAVYLSIPGPKMLWQFGELGYDESINRCEDGTINNDCRLASKPIRWDDLDIDHRKNTYDRLAALLHLRKNSEAFHTPNFSFNDEEYFKRIKLNGTDMNVLTLANFDINEMKREADFQHTGSWYEYLSGEEISVTDVNMEMELKPGEFKIFTSNQVLPPNGFFSSTTESLDSKIRLYPNPITANEIITLELKNRNAITVIDSNGKNIPISTHWDSDIVKIRLDSKLGSGLYYMRIRDKNKLRVIKFVYVE